MQFSDKEENYRLILIFGPPLRTINRGKDLAEWKNGATFVPGKLAEWSIAAVLKTVEPQGSGGSNPSLSAKVRRIKKRCTVKFTFTVHFVFGLKQENAVLSRLLVSYSVYLNLAEKSTPI